MINWPKTPIVLLTTILWMGCAAGSDSANPAGEVVARSHALDAVISSGDARLAADFYAEDFLLTSSRGTFKTKEDMLRDIASPELVLEINRTENVRVRVNRDTAILTGKLRQKGVYRGQSFDATMHVTDTWVRTPEGWRLMGGHASPVSR